MRPHRILAVIGGALLLGTCRKGSVCGDCLDNTGVHLEFPDPPVNTEQPAAVLFSGWRNDRCQTDVLCTGAKEVFLGDVRWRPGQFRFADLSRFCDKKELVTFASGRTPATLYSTGGLALPPPGTDWFGPPKEVDVTLWEVDAGGWDKHDADQSTAQTLFATLGTGMTMKFAVGGPPLSLTPTNGSYFECDAQSTNGGPANGDPSRARQLLPGYVPKAINVYYVTEVRAPAVALTCPDANNPAAAWNVIFMAANHDHRALAHELGHALGLNRTATLPGGTSVWTGDIDELDMNRAFGDNNLMFYANLDPGNLTIGQIYRMHFDIRSWVNQGVPPVNNGYPRACQDSPASEGPCPPLALRPPEGWP
jgi:hypothetical protein